MSDPQLPAHDRLADEDDAALADALAHADESEEDEDES